MIDINVRKLKPYLITLDENSPEVDMKSMKDSGVVGALICAGHLFTANHVRLDVKANWFRNPKMTSQIKLAKEFDLDFGLYFYARAQSKYNVEDEIKGISNIIRNNYASLGVWLVPDLTANKSINDSLLDTYYKELQKLGVTERVGIYCTRSFLSKITWTNHCNRWYLWLVEHVDDMSVLDTVLDPEFFNVET